jgi:type II secretory pathway pseudopilin PulG
MVRQALRRSTGSGRPVIQFLIVVAIAGVVAAMAIPVYAARAKESVLRQNAKTLELEVKSYLAAGETVAGSGTDGQGGAFVVVARTLRGPEDGISACYVNPLCGSHAIVCQAALPSVTGTTPPAVWITDDQQYAYAAFTASPATKSHLRGTLMVVFVTHSGRASGIEIYYVDAAGERSPTSTTLATAG